MYQDINYEDNIKDLDNWNQLNQACSYSPIETILYYLNYPRQLFKDAHRNKKNVFIFFCECYNSALGYYFKKYKNK